MLDSGLCPFLAAMTNPKTEQWVPAEERLGPGEAMGMEAADKSSKKFRCEGAECVGEVGVGVGSSGEVCGDPERLGRLWAGAEE